MSFKFKEHTADIKIIAKGKTIENVFEECVLAISEYVAGKKPEIHNLERKIKVSGRDMESLLYNFVDELLFILDTERFCPARAIVKISEKKDYSLDANLFGFDTKGKSLNHIKAPTYAEMKIEKKKSGWEVHLVIDV